MNLLARSAFAGFRAHAISLRGVLLLGLFVGGGAWAQNDAFEFTPSGDQIRVEDESHWRNWIYQNNLVRDVSSPIDSSGLFTFSGLGTKPIYLTDIKNYVLDAGDFEYLNPLPGGALTTGGITALSRTEWASRVGDRDPTTFWQPADSDFDSEGLRNWQVLVDLGRTVFADSIVVVLPPIAAGGEEAVPLIPDDVESLSDLSADLEASVPAALRWIHYWRPQTWSPTRVIPS